MSLAVTGGTATGGGVDYNNVPLIVTMPANPATKTFTIDIVNDTLGEANENITLQVASVTGGFVGDDAQHHGQHHGTTCPASRSCSGRRPWPNR